MDSDSNPFAHDMQLQHAHDIKRWLKRQRRFFRSRAEQSRAWLARRDGSQGAAGPCKRIDPKTGAVIEILEGPIIVT